MKDKQFLSCELAIHRYVEALDLGDMETVAVILAIATANPELDRIIKAIDLAYIEEEKLADDKAIDLAYIEEEKLADDKAIASARVVIKVPK